MRFHTISEAIAYFAEKTPDKICLIESETGRKCTYHEFWNYVKAFSQRLVQCGLQKGERVLIVDTQDLECLVAIQAVYLAGGILIETMNNSSQERISELVEQFGVEMYIAAEPPSQECGYVGKYMDISRACDSAALILDADIAFPDPDNISDIIFTTGTTGKPKGVMLSNKSSICCVEDSISLFGLFNEDNLMFTFPLGVYPASGSIYYALYCGGTSVLSHSTVELKNFLEAVAKYDVTAIVTAPAFITFALETAPAEFKECLKKVRSIQMGGASPQEPYIRRLRELLPDTAIYNIYGTTETGTLSIYDYGKYPYKPSCIGIPSPLPQLYFIDEQGKTMENTSEMNPGTLVCEGGNVMVGYWQDEELTKSVLDGNRIILADVGYEGEDGFLYIIGRKDDVISVGSGKVAPFEIEHLVMKLPSIRECVCVPQADKIMGHVPKLFVVMNDGYEFSPKEIFGFLSNKLEAFKMPRAVECLEELPKIGALQKVDKKQLV